MSVENTPAERYLDLLKKTLTFTLWPEPLEPLEHFSAERTPLKRLAVSLVAGVLRLGRFHLTKEVTPTWRGVATAATGLTLLTR